MPEPPHGTSNASSISARFHAFILSPGGSLPAQSSGACAPEPEGGTPGWGQVDQSLRRALIHRGRSCALGLPAPLREGPLEPLPEGASPALAFLRLGERRALEQDRRFPRFVEDLARLPFRPLARGDRLP